MTYLLGKITVFTVFALLAVSLTIPQCKAPNVFDSIDRKCKHCPTNCTYNKLTKQCDCKVSCELPRKLSANNICECQQDGMGTKRVWSESDKTCYCSQNLPYWNGKYCTKCPSGLEYNPKEHQCYHCPEGFSRDQNNHVCIPEF